MMPAACPRKPRHGCTTEVVPAAPFATPSSAAPFTCSAISEFTSWVGVYAAEKSPALVEAGGRAGPSEGPKKPNETCDLSGIGALKQLSSRRSSGHAVTFPGCAQAGEPARDPPAVSHASANRKASVASVFAIAKAGCWPLLERGSCPRRSCTPLRPWERVGLPGKLVRGGSESVPPGLWRFWFRRKGSVGFRRTSSREPLLRRRGSAVCWLT